MSQDDGRGFTRELGKLKVVRRDGKSVIIDKHTNEVLVSDYTNNFPNLMKAQMLIYKEFFDAPTRKNNWDK